MNLKRSIQIQFIFLQKFKIDSNVQEIVDPKERWIWSFYGWIFAWDFTLGSHDSDVWETLIKSKRAWKRRKGILYLEELDRSTSSWRFSYLRAHTIRFSGCKFFLSNMCIYQGEGWGGRGQAPTPALIDGRTNVQQDDVTVSHVLRQKKEQNVWIDHYRMLNSSFNRPRRHLSIFNLFFLFFNHPSNHRITNRKFTVFQKCSIYSLTEVQVKSGRHTLGKKVHLIGRKSTDKSNHNQF